MKNAEQVELDYRCPECRHEGTVLITEYRYGYVECPGPECDRTLKVQHEGGYQRTVSIRSMYDR